MQTSTWLNNADKLRPVLIVVDSIEYALCDDLGYACARSDACYASHQKQLTRDGG